MQKYSQKKYKLQAKIIKICKNIKGDKIVPLFYSKISIGLCVPTEKI